MFEKFFKPTPVEQWWDNLDSRTKTYLKKQPIWHDRDLWKAGIVGTIVGFAIGFLVGFETGFKPVVTVIRPLIG